MSKTYEMRIPPDQWRDICMGLKTYECVPNIPLYNNIKILDTIEFTKITSGDTRCLRVRIVGLSYYNNWWEICDDINYAKIIPSAKDADTVSLMYEAIPTNKNRALEYGVICIKFDTLEIE